jgi:hypothetical protein
VRFGADDGQEYYGELIDVELDGIIKAYANSL